MAFTIELDGRRALVTGAGQGVGRAIALAIARAGGTVLVNDVVAERAGSVVEEIRSAGGAAEVAAFDVTDLAAVDRAVEAAGDVDILVNNAGNAGVESWRFTPFAETEAADCDRYLQVNLYGVLHCTRAVLPGMIRGGYGRVVTIVSDAARWGEPTMAVYSAAKAGAAGLSRAVAREVGRHGITVNNVALGTIDPGGGDSGPGEGEAGPGGDAGPGGGDAAEHRRNALRQYIIRRPGRPDDVAGLVTLLVSPLASWITGQTIPVNGGYTVNL